jgi:hypothetical protein
VNDWKYVTVYLESVAAEEGSASAIAKNLLRKLTILKFIYVLHFLLDYLVILKNLSLLFQREQIFLCTTELNVKNVMAPIESLKLSPGQ